jgi:hypothetical protein
MQALIPYIRMSGAKHFAANLIFTKEEQKWISINYLMN